MKRNDIYKCKKDGVVFEILSNVNIDIPEDASIENFNEQTADFATEKHVPILTETEQGIKITVGSTLHPMTEEHFIEWIEVINGDYVNRKYLNPGDAPEAEFYVQKQDGLIVRQFCNVHGLWKSN